MAFLPALAAALALASVHPAAAQTARDGAYEALLRQASALAAVEPTDQERRQLMRAMAVTLADGLKRFTIAETEARADDKVAAPPAAGLRPGEGAEPGAKPPGAREPVPEVPNPWFARYATDARAELDRLIAALDAGDEAAADLMLKADTVNLLLRDLVRPPEG
ncbi:MAG: hypothetical protein NXI21_10845 [Alphaproteobacteria bacterium]|nr:hypothetical protein [Alphaproteobacteria bacterium]